MIKWVIGVFVVLLLIVVVAINRINNRFKSRSGWGGEGE